MICGMATNRKIWKQRGPIPQKTTMTTTNKQKQKNNHKKVHYCYLIKMTIHENDSNFTPDNIKKQQQLTSYLTILILLLIAAQWSRLTFSLSIWLTSKPASISSLTRGKTPYWVARTMSKFLKSSWPGAGLLAGCSLVGATSFSCLATVQVGNKLTNKTSSSLPLPFPPSTLTLSYSIKTIVLLGYRI